MNKSTTRVLALFCLFASIGTRGAMAQSLPGFTIPFGFTVGSKSFAAGEYRVDEVSPHVLQIRSRDMRSSIMTNTVNEEHGTVEGKATMTFHRYGDRYFLTRVATPDRGWGVPPSKVEKELIATRAPVKSLGVIASSR
jgi:hypothetical protein